MDELRPLLVRIAEDGIQVAFSQIGFAAGADVVDQVNEQAVQWATARAAELVGMRVAEDGSLVENPNAQWAITDATRTMLRADVVEAIQEGTSTADLATQIAGAYAFSETRASMIARTELARADVQGNMLAYRDSGQVKGKEWILGSEHEEMDECDDAAGMGVVPLDSDFGGIGDPPAHPNCFLPDTLVSAAGVTAHFRRWFDGEVITVRTERQEFTATPNHPILTGRGWVAAGALQVGDHLLECTDPRAAVLLLDPNDHHVETPIEEIASTLGMAGGVSTVRVPTAAEDFHGDGVADGDVDVVRPARTLEPWREAEPDEGALDSLHGDGPSAAALLAPAGALDEFREGAPLPAHSVVSGRGATLPLLGREAGIVDAVRVAAVADGETSAPESVADRQAVTTESAREVHRRLAGLIQPVEVREIRKRQFAGHVYNLSTRDHYYIANAVIVHNCVCDVLPVLASEGGDEGD